MNTSRYMTRAQTSRLIKRILKESYPGVAFSLTTSHWTLNIHCTDGPGQDEVEELLGFFKSGYFEGNVGMYFREVCDVAYGGQILVQLPFVFVNDTWTDAVKAQIGARLEPETLAAWRRKALDYSGRQALERACREVCDLLCPLQPSKTLKGVKPVPQDEPLDGFLEKQRGELRAATERDALDKHLRSRKRRNGQRVGAAQETQVARTAPRRL